MDLLEGEENRDEWISHMEKAAVSAYKTNAQRNIRVRLTGAGSGIWPCARSSVG